jgi:hypothetical protein
MISPKTVCISHGEDADGLICAALLLRLKNASPILVTYDELEDALRGIIPPVEQLYICDLNIREALVDEMYRINGFSSVTIIDHHPWAEGLMESLRDVGVNVLHSLQDSASVILYDHFRRELGREAGRLAAYAAWTDQFEEGPIASLLLWEYDRQLVQHEALILGHAVVRNQTHEFWQPLVEELSKLAFPHEIPGVVDASLTHLREMTHLLGTLPKKATRIGRFAYVDEPDNEPIGTVANLLLDALGVDIGLCYKATDMGHANVSIRSRRGLTIHLGEITRSVAMKHGGFGGGHKRASGASLPWSNLKGFIDELARELA